VGELQKGKRTGKGTYTDVDGHTFTGTWTDDLLNGMGSYEGPEGKYEGDWKDNLKHGKGTMTWTSGDRYVGAWTEDNMNGEGQFFWTNGKAYDGQWVDGLREGRGALTFPNGSKYVGDWCNDQCHGKGKFTEDNGAYEGDWVENKKHGHGTYTYKDGRIYDGDWINDKKTKGFVRTPDGNVFKVTFNDKGEVIDQQEATEADMPSKKAAAGRQAPASGSSSPEKHPQLRHVEGSAGGHGGSNLKVDGERVGGQVREWESGEVPQKRGPVDPTKTRHFRDSIPYDELQVPSKHNRPQIDSSQREFYLSDAEFKKLFGVDKDTFKALPKWKQNTKKKELKLF
jgi:hypothetical protein